MRLPELALSEREAMAMAGAMLNVEQHYGITPSPKLQAFIGLAGTAWAIYAPRLGAVVERTRSAKVQRQRNGPFHFEARPEPPAPPPHADAAAEMGVIFPTGAPDGGTINFGG